MKKDNKKFKVGDIVFYINYEDNIEINRVVSEKEATKISYIDKDGWPSIEIIRQNSNNLYNCNPIFLISYNIETGSIYGIPGWMPENQLFLYNKTARILYGK